MAVIAIVTSAPPLTDGGHLVLARSLQRALEESGHQAGIVTTPSNRFGRQGSAYLANWLTDVGVTGANQRIDQVISLRFPSYAVRHRAHVCWLVHTMREYYDLWDRFAADLSAPNRMKERVRRRLIRSADTHFLKRVSRRFAISGAVRDRLRTWNGLEAEALHPPAPQRPYRCEGYGDFVFVASRLTPLKRVDMVLHALAHPLAGQTRGVIAGEGDQRPALESLAHTLGLAGRVTFTGHLSDEQLVDHLARCRAVVFNPLEEDYGFVTVEAFSSAKAVITCADSGGPLELVRDNENGWVVAPTAEALAGAIAEAMRDEGTARARGMRGRAGMAELSWPAVVRKLVIV